MENTPLEGASAKPASGRCLVAGRAAALDIQPLSVLVIALVYPLSLRGSPMVMKRLST